MDLSQLAPADRERARLQLAQIAWRRSDLQYQLKPTQQKIAAAIAGTKSRRFFLLCSRRLGKSHMLVNQAVQTCLQKPGARVLYGAPFGKNAEEISGDIAPKVFEDCPPDLKPEYQSQAKEFRFPNGSIIRIKGVNGEHAQYLRGGAADLIILDECGLMDDLKHVVNDICMPMTMTTGGRILLATTPARSPAHDSTKIYEDLVGIGAASTFTIRDNDMADDETKVEYLVIAGETYDHAREVIAGRAEPHSTTAKREYFCEFVTDADSAVVPEFTLDLQKRIVRTWTRPAFFDAYVSIDPGFKDRTGILYGYWDFTAGKFIVQDESLLSHANTSDIAEALQDRESALWGGKPPLLRVSDVDLRLVADLRSLHGIACIPTRKEDSLGAVNLMRNMIQSEQVIIDPRCVNLVRQLKNATWNHRATDFEQGGDIDGHYDLVAALKYLCRNISKSRNPFPDHWWRPGGGGGPPTGSWVSPKGSKVPGLGLLSDTPFGRKIARKQRG